MPYETEKIGAVIQAVTSEQVTGKWVGCGDYGVHWDCIGRNGIDS